MNIDDINWNLLKQFIVVAESSSLLEASGKLSCSASNLSHNISTLENQLGTQLFTRNPLRLTTMGQDIYEKVKNGFDEINFGLAIAESKNNIEYGKISIGCPSHITEFFLMEKIEKATKDYPNLQISLETEANNEQFIELLRSNKIDFAILGPTSKKYSYELNVENIKNIDNIFISKDKITINDMKELENYKYILPYESKSATKNLIKALNEYDVKLKSVISCPTTEPRVEAAKRGIGIAYVVRESAKTELENRQVYEVNLPIELPNFSVNLVYINNYLTKVDKEFIKKYIRT